MSTYTITIAPNDKSGNTTTLLVDTSGADVRVTDVHLHAGDGLSDGRLPVVDFGLLLQAIRPGRVAPTRIAAAPAAAATAKPRRLRASQSAAQTPAKAARTSRSSRASAGASDSTRVTKSARRTTRKSVEPTAAETTRAYRKMPDDIRDVLAQAGTATGVADHYGVPRHTATGWVRRVRREDGTS